MTQSRASFSTNRPKNDLWGSKSEEIEMKNTHGTRSTDLPDVWTGLQTENYCCRHYTLVETKGKINKTFFSEFPFLKPMIKV